MFLFRVIILVPVFCLAVVITAAQQPLPDWTKQGGNQAGNVALEQGRIADAVAIGEGDLASAVSVYGPTDPRIRDKLDFLAVANFARGNYQKAEEFYRRSLMIAEKAYGPEHAETVESLNNVMGVLMAQNRMDEALAIQERVLEASR